MNQLVITLKGEVLSTNFTEWKNDLIAQIQSVNTKLMTDHDFVEAMRYVKVLKSAEQSLKDAKQSSISQVYDIQRLFMAIDEISEHARQTRLSLERQINVRKAELKQQYIQSGIDHVKAFIQQQSTDFKLIDHDQYLSYSRFEAVVKGKSNIKGLQSAIGDECSRIKTDILQRAAEVSQNGLLLDTLPNPHKLLFQDRRSLIALSQQELRLTIEKRITAFNKETERRQTEQVTHEYTKKENADSNSDVNILTEEVAIGEKEKYRIIIDILSSEEEAVEMARSIREVYGNKTSVLNIQLTRNKEGNISLCSQILAETVNRQTANYSGSIRMICLAASRKYGGYCIAGREWSDGQIGPWIRPVSKRENGELALKEIKLPKGIVPHILGILRIPVAGPALHPYQGENVFINEAAVWENEGRLPFATVESCCENPDTLWLNEYHSTNGLNDRIPDEIACQERRQSLYIIKPDAFSLIVSHEFGGKKKVRANIDYNNVRYRLGVTDPEIEKQYLQEDVGEYLLPKGKVYLTISLGESFQGFAYKLVAGVITEAR